MNLTVRDISLDCRRELTPVQKLKQLVHQRAERTMGNRNDRGWGGREWAKNETEIELRVKKEVDEPRVNQLQR
jgi:hypothetical protein